MPCTLSLADLVAATKDFQDRTQDARSCAQRRRARVPMQARDLFACAANAVDATEHQELRRLAREVLRAHVARARERQLRWSVRAGRALTRRSGLVDIDAIRTENGDLDDVLDGLHCLRTAFESKWRAGDATRLELIRSIDECAYAVPLDITREEVVEAWPHMQRRTLCDGDGICAEALRCISIAHPDVLPQFLNTWLSRGSTVAEARVVGIARGKATRRPTPGAVRVIVPLPTVMALADVVLSRRLHSFLTTRLPVPRGTMAAAVPNSNLQAMDVGHAASLFIERSMDRRSTGGWATCDILQYYDNIDCIRCWNYLIAAGLPGATATAILRHQLFVQFSMRFAGRDAAVDLRARTRGTLTGSRTAGALGRIAVEDAFRSRWHAWQPWGLRINDTLTLTAASYVDNLMAVSTSPHRACTILDDAAAFLKAKWNLEIKPGSREVLIVANSADDFDGDAEVDDNGWRRRKHLRVLGMMVSSDATVREDVHQASRAMWRSFWMNSGSAHARRLSVAERLRLLDTCTTPVLDFRAARWPPNESVRKLMNAVQTRMYACIMRTPPYPDETREAFVRRRGRAAGREADRRGRWGDRVRDRAQAWLDHLLRHASGPSWAALLLPWHGREWIRERRLTFGTNSESGRTQTRARAGPVPSRWHDTVVLTQVEPRRAREHARRA